MSYAEQASASALQSGKCRFRQAIVANLPQRALRLSLVTCGLVVPLTFPGWHAITTLSPAPLQVGALPPPDSQPYRIHEATGKDAAAESQRPAPMGAADELRGTVVNGDRLKITFLESLGVALDHSGSGPADVVATVFPRMDLSAEYMVDEGGSVDVPRLGRFATAGRTLPTLQSGLAAAFKRVFGRTSDVSVAIVERQPIYVLGAVRNAGTFKYMPGMIVLQALANAGGTELGAGDTSAAIENIRETERLRQAVDRRDRLLVEQARLVAYRTNSTTIVIPADLESRFSKMTSRGRLDAVLAGETAILISERRSYEQLLSLAEQQVTTAQTEVQAQQLRIVQLATLAAKKTDRLHELEQVAARGNLPQYRLGDVNIDISELVARQEDHRVSQAQAQQRLLEAQIARAKLELDHFVGIEKELAAIAQQIDDCDQAIVSMQAVTELLRSHGPAVVKASADIPNIRITRRGPDGFTMISATKTTMLLPGDVVQVGSSAAIGSAISAEAEVVPSSLQ